MQLTFSHEPSSLDSRTWPCQKSREALCQWRQCNDWAGPNPFQRSSRFYHSDDALLDSSWLYDSPHRRGLALQEIYSRKPQRTCWLRWFWFKCWGNSFNKILFCHLKVKHSLIFLNSNLLLFKTFKYFHVFPNINLGNVIYLTQNTQSNPFLLTLSRFSKLISAIWTKLKITFLRLN